MLLVNDLKYKTEDMKYSATVNQNWGLFPFCQMTKSCTQSFQELLKLLAAPTIYGYTFQISNGLQLADQNIQFLNALIILRHHHS